jgi:hypothetical protein
VVNLFFYHHPYRGRSGLVLRMLYVQSRFGRTAAFGLFLALGGFITIITEEFSSHGHVSRI